MAASLRGSGTAVKKPTPGGFGLSVASAGRDDAPVQPNAGGKGGAPISYDDRENSLCSSCFA
jgi:hypothetical protein